MSSEKLQSLRDRQLALHGEALALGEHQIAYHALAAVLHAGESLRDIPTIDLVEERANDHAGWLTRNDPKHPLSAQSAATRGHQSIFEQLAATAAAARARIKSENRARK